ncbi:MAG TPA: NifB/NifX family molybdenum-iron cluster-binding protein [Bacteroidales bacterium]|nr:NifB/NifX family molybdenum-iron cluster-binding protein [Bacteroidales bacterium]
MIVAIAASENHKKSVIDLHFGRCEWYCLFNSITGDLEFIENSFRFKKDQAGLDAAKMLIARGAGIIVAGRFGAKVMEVLRENNIQMVVPQTRQDISKFLNSFR